MVFSKRGDFDMPSQSRIGWELAAGGAIKLFLDKDSSDNLQIHNAPVFIDGFVLGAAGNSVLSNFTAAAAFTPTITAASTAGTPSYTTQVGRWNRIGDRVFFSVNLLLSGWSGSPAGKIQVVLPSDLPIPVTSTGYVEVCQTVWGTYTVQSGGLDLVGRVNSGSRSIDIFETKSNSSGFQNSSAGQTGASTISLALSGSYLVD